MLYLEGFTVLGSGVCYLCRMIQNVVLTLVLYNVCIMGVWGFKDANYS